VDRGDQHRGVGSHWSAIEIGMAATRRANAAIEDHGVAGAAEHATVLTKGAPESHRKAMKRRGKSSCAAGPDNLVVSLPGSSQVLPTGQWDGASRWGKSLGGDL
jgi:hypothetical protein